MKKYVVKTKSGSLYELLDVAHMFGSDRWVVQKDEKQYFLICFANVRGVKGGPFGRGVDSSKRFIRIAEKVISTELAHGTAKGKILIYASKANFESVMKMYEQMVQTSKTNDEDKMIAEWKYFQKHVSHSSEIVEIFHE